MKYEYMQTRAAFEVESYWEFVDLIMSDPYRPVWVFRRIVKE